MKLVLRALTFALLTSLAPLAHAADHIVGVGVVLSQRDHHFYVSELVPGAPAALDGTVKAGDEIVSVKPFPGEQPGWLPVDQLSLPELVQLVRGDAGTEVGLHLGNAQGQYQLYLKRAGFDVP